MEKIIEFKNRSLNAEWIPFVSAYRLYDSKYPQGTVAYETDLERAERIALEMGYDDLALVDLGFCDWTV